MQSHLTALIPYYDEAEGDDRRRLHLLNSLLVSRFEEPGMMYWNIFRNAPQEINDYADLFGADLSEEDKGAIIDFFLLKKAEVANMVDMGFDEDGEEDTIFRSGNEEDETFESDGDTVNDEDENNE